MSEQTKSDRTPSQFNDRFVDAMQRQIFINVVVGKSQNRSIDEVAA